MTDLAFAADDAVKKQLAGWQRDLGAVRRLSPKTLEAYHGDLARFLEQLNLFRIGASWGGLHSLVAPVKLEGARRTKPWQQSANLVRFSIGLEHPEDLLADLEQGLARYSIDREVAAG